MCTATSSQPEAANANRPDAMLSQQAPAVRLRQELRDLDSEREGIEAEVALLSARLNASGQPGIKGSLLDKEVSSEVPPAGLVAEATRPLPEELPPSLICIVLNHQHSPHLF